MNLKPYTQEEIERIFKERVRVIFHHAQLKNALIGEWSFMFPTGYITLEVELAAPMDESNYNEDKAQEIIYNKIKQKLWEIAGKYTLATGDKL